MASEYLLLLAGLLILFIGGKFLVESSVAIAGIFRIPTMIVGLTVVAFGTSAPELLVSLQAALKGYPEIAVGNVVGSNISNILLVLAITAIIYPIAVPRKSITRDWSIMMVVSILLFLLIMNGMLGIWEAAGLFLLLIGYIVYSVLEVKRDKSSQERIGTVRVTMKWWVAIILFVVSAAALAYGADLLVENAALIAESLGISKRVISISMVAVGTSIPELATSVIAAMKKQTGISLGNILGSNLMNIVAVLGLTGMITPIKIEKDLVWFDTPVMIGSGLILLVLSVIRPVLLINRWKGIFMVLVYLLYLYLIF